LVYLIIYETKDVPWYDEFSEDNRHLPVNQLVLEIALDVLLNCMSKAQEVVNEACQALMADNVKVQGT
jgi:hypothetical protein